jgi:hypothetical protein
MEKNKGLIWSEPQSEFSATSLLCAKKSIKIGLCSNLLKSRMPINYMLANAPLEFNLELVMFRLSKEVGCILLYSIN